VDRAGRQRYLEAFHALDYETALAFYAETFEVVFAGDALRSCDEVCRLYALSVPPDERGRIVSARYTIYEPPRP
jgi:hypothetical protein